MDQQLDQQIPVESLLHNSHLPSEPFFMEGGSVGVLLSHGYTATPAEVRLLAERLHQHGYTVAGLRLPGHGTSPEDMNRCTWHDWTEAFEREYQLLAERCKTIFVGGESMGGMLALHTARRYPEIAGILTYSPAMRVRTQIVWLSYLLAPFLPHVKKRNIEFINKNWQGYPVNPVRALTHLHRLQRAVRRELPQIKQPFLLVQGRLDTSIDLRGTEELYQLIGSPLKEMHWMERSGHVVVLEQELDDVTAITLRFMEQALMESDRNH